MYMNLGVVKRVDEGIHEIQRVLPGCHLAEYAGHEQYNSEQFSHEMLYVLGLSQEIKILLQVHS